MTLRYSITDRATEAREAGSVSGKRVKMGDSKKLSANLWGDSAVARLKAQQEFQNQYGKDGPAI